MNRKISRRGFNLSCSAASLGATSLGASIGLHPKFAHANWTSIVQQPFGVMSGEVTNQSAVIWGRADAESRMMVQWDTDANFKNPRSVIGPEANLLSDYTARCILGGLPSGSKIHYQVTFENAAGISDPQQGQLTTPDDGTNDVFFAWSGDTAGQGFGINLDWGGMKIYSAIEKLAPDFFVHSGDMIYADNPIQPELTLNDGSIWKNITTAAKSKPAASLDDFRGNYLYNLLDKNVLAFHRSVPLIASWDDHETTNNWYPQQRLRSRKDRDNYDAMEFALQLADRARQAFFEYTPLLPQASGQRRIYRKLSRGPLLDLFVLDLRSYRGPNSPNKQPQLDSQSTILGPEQLAWLKHSLRTSTATWKVICSDMPLAISVGDSMEGKNLYEAVANADPGAPLGRELEMADLLEFMKQAQITNTVWLTADVHYAAAHYYDPKRAAIPDRFLAFWEFVAGPLHSGSFGPNALDGTFGPEVKFLFAPPPASKLPLSPSDGRQSFGTVRVDAKSKRMTVELRGLSGEVLDGGSFTLEPQNIPANS
ncbi:MAG: alkaline phosphatase D family protein [Planctomycetota bacterium]|nr:alkaline phosphatase D family protein [Planctomycetota bacterium]